ncbi:MAG TPA: adenosylcobinamide-GDP ribazoletransferase [Actinobacteria bacterium]|nr:adenosylcobinamide-GDP ribazoletransferase [Actinomycetota bacterium]
MLIEQINYLLISISFLTIIPISGFGRAKDSSPGKATAFFPLVGLLVGGLGVLLSIGLDEFLPSQVGNVLIILYLTVITGGLHLDGLADTVDALAAKGSRQKKLAVMRQGEVGPFGAAAVVFDLLLKYAFLNSLTASPKLAAILVAPALARWPITLLLWRVPTARRDGLGYGLARSTTAGGFVVASATTLLVILGLSAQLGWLNLLLIPILIIIALFSAKLSRTLLGGITGDTLGATIELTETALFLLLGVLAYYA